MTNLHYQYNDKTHSLNHGKIEKGYNAFHIHASYDLFFQYTQNSLFKELKNISANYQKSLDLYIFGFLIEIYEILFFYNSILNKIKPINEN